MNYLITAAGRGSRLIKRGIKPPKPLVIVNGIEKEAYSEILQDIMKQVKAEVGVVGINKQGIWSVNTKPFSALNFRFDYHAYTSNPGNNRPGFAIVRPK